MKKIFAALLIALFGAVSLFADDAADVREVIVNSFELTKNGDFAGKLALCTPDYLETTSLGKTINYEQAKLLTAALDGKHPEEFMLFAVWFQKRRHAFGEQRSEDPSGGARPEFIKQYETVIVPAMVSEYKTVAAFELKTLKFISVKIHGRKAVAIIEFDSRNSRLGVVTHETEIISLCKIGGEWKIHRSVVKNK